MPPPETTQSPKGKEVFGKVTVTAAPAAVPVPPKTNYLYLSKSGTNLVFAWVDDGKEKILWAIRGLTDFTYLAGRRMTPTVTNGAMVSYTMPQPPWPTGFFRMQDGTNHPYIGLIWDRSPEPIVTGYRIYYGTATRSYTNIVDAGSSTNIVISNLAPRVEYHFAATAYETNGLESEFSDECIYVSP